LTITEPGARQFEGELVDVSSSGFRAAHRLADLDKGQEILFRHGRGSGHAKVMWTRIVGGEAESGFLVL